MIFIFKRLTLLLIILILGISINAYSAGEFLEIGIGSAAIGTGEDYIGKCDDFSAAFWNPAGLSFINNMLAGFHMFLYYEGIKMNNISLIFPWKKSDTLGISSTFIYDDIPYTSMNADGTIHDYGKNYSFFDMNIMASYARKISSLLAVGGNLKYVHSGIEEESANAFAIDAGLFAKGILLNNLNFGAVFVNIGPGLTYINESANLPSAFKIGISKLLFALADNEHKIIFLNDHIMPFYNVYIMNSGLEYILKDFFFLRTGYQYS